MLRRLLAPLCVVLLAIGQGAGRAVFAARLAPLLLLTVRWVSAKVLISQEEALRKAFPPPVEIQRKTLFFTDDQIHRIESAARARMETRVLTYYEAISSGQTIGAVFFDTRVVRTMPMTIMALVKPDGTLDYVEILSFYEPSDYLPRAGWLNLFRGKVLDDKLWLRWGIPNVAGCSLTCESVTSAVRCMLAAYREAVQKESR